MGDEMGEVKATQVAKGAHIVQASDHSTAILNENVYENVFPHPVEQAIIDAAVQRLAELPLDTLPTVGSLPAGSRIRAIARNPSFVGREVELRRLATFLKDSGTATAAITGLGGIGKSQLANEFVYRYGRYFRGGVFWLSFADANAIPTEVASCRTALGQELRLDTGTLSVAEQVQLVLAAWQNELPRLLVFDNCEEESLLATWRPPTGGCRILLTSRRAPWHVDLSVQVVPLEVLPRDKSIALLGKYSADLSIDDRDAIANEVGDLPLALYLAGNYLNEYQGSPLGVPATYLASLRSMTSLHQLSLPEEGITYTTGHEENIERTFAFSYERLDPANTIDACALKLLARTASFAPGEPVPRELLRASVGQTEDNQFEAIVAQAFRRLTALGLLDRQVGETYHMHRLLTIFVRQRSASSDPEARQDVERVLLERVQELNTAGYPAPLLALQAHLRAVTNAALVYKDPLAGDLSSILGAHLISIGAYTEAQSYLEQSLAIHKHLLESEHPDVALCFNNLAALYYYQGKYEEAESHYQQALVIWQKALGLEHPNVATCFSNLGQLYSTQGKYEEAESRFQQALAIQQKVLGPEHPDVALSFNNLAALYYYQGKYEESESHYQQALAIQQKALGPEHPDVARSLNNLGQLYSTQGKYEEAKSSFQQALITWQKALGPEHPDVARNLNNLGLLYYYQGKYEEAESHYQQALAIQQKALGSEHPDVGFSFNNLGALYYYQNRYEEAESSFQQALVIWQKALGAEHPDVARSLNNLGALYESQGRYEEAESCFQQALPIQQKALGLEHPDVALSFNNLGLVYYYQGKYEEAESYYRQALAIQQKALGPEHPNVALSFNNLGQLYSKQGKYEEAEPRFQQALAIWQKVLGLEHPDAARSLNNLAALYESQGRYEEAESYYRQALAIWQKVLGAEHPDVATLLENYASLLHKMKREGEAIKLEERAQAIRAKQPGDV